MHNHFPFNYHLGNKKALFYNLRKYYQLTKQNIHEVIPLTFHLKNGTADNEYRKFTR
jgi:tubulin polyglutamylase TTLL1